MNTKYNNLPKAVGDHKRQHIVVFSGAGMSAESGLSTFRDENGLWKQYDWQRLASIEGFAEEPQAVLDFYNMRRKRLLEVEPNNAHRLIAELEKWHDVTVITQNVDDLHERAGTSKVIHLHGELKKVTSSENRDDPNCIEELPLDVPIRIGDKAADGSQLRPYIVWFGEFVNAMESAIEIVRMADIFVVVGTSLTVHPAARLLHYAQRNIPKFIINPGKLERIPDDYVHIKENASSGMETFVDWVRENTGVVTLNISMPPSWMFGITDIEIPEEYCNEELIRLTSRKKDESGIEIGEHPLFFNEKLDDCK